MMKFVFKMNLILCIWGGVVHHTWAKEDQISALIKKVNVQSYVDGSGNTYENQLIGKSSWKIRCQYKVFDDKKVCLMTKGPISLMKLNSSYILNVGENHTKNSMAQIRIDNNASLKAREGLFRHANDLITQFKQGYYVYTRYNSSKTGEDVEHKLSLIGFSFALNEMENQFRKINTNGN